MGVFDTLKKLSHPYDDADDDFFGSAADEASVEEERPARRPPESPGIVPDAFQVRSRAVSAWLTFVSFVTFLRSTGLK